MHTSIKVHVVVCFTLLLMYCLWFKPFLHFLSIFFPGNDGSERFLGESNPKSVTSQMVPLQGNASWPHLQCFFPEPVSSYPPTPTLCWFMIKVLSALPDVIGAVKGTGWGLLLLLHPFQNPCKKERQVLSLLLLFQILVVLHFIFFCCHRSLSSNSSRPPYTSEEQLSVEM